jgi:hypothetical protein
LERWGLDKQTVIDKFTANHDGVWSGTSHPDSVPTGDHTLPVPPTAESDYQAFTRDITALIKQEKILRAMEEQAYADTPEYNKLNLQTQELRESIYGLVEKEFRTPTNT